MASPTDAELKKLFENPLPWFTLGSINLLQKLVRPTDKVLELGGGVSTLWWLQRVSFVLTAEANGRWAPQLMHAVGSRPHLLAKWSLLYCPAEWPEDHRKPKLFWQRNAEHLTDDRARVLAQVYNNHSWPFKIDIIVIDGAARRDSVDATNEHIKENEVRLIVVDNMESMVRFIPDTFKGYEPHHFPATEEDQPRFAEGQKQWSTSVFVKQ